VNDIHEIESRIKKSKGEPTTENYSNNNINNEKPTSKKNIVIMNGNQRTTLLSEGENEKMKSIDEIVDAFLKIVNGGMSRERVLEVLNFNSFNLERTYNFLAKPEEFALSNEYPIYI
jgi:hypothetical protein